MDAVLFAKTYGADEVLNLSNIEYVFDKDPKKFTDSKKIENISWLDFRKNIIGDKWEPGKNLPFDPVASKEAEKIKLTVKILAGKNLSEVKKALNNKKFKGTVIR
jgi:uridylate kinase